MKRNILVIQLIFSLFVGQAVAQTPLNIAGVKYIIHNFKTDSAFSYDDWFVQSKIVSSIKLSHYPLEIRFWFKPWFMRKADEGECLIIKGDKDSLFADLYQLSSSIQPPHNGGGVLFRKDKFNSIGDITLHHYHFTNHPKLDSLVKLLLLNGIADQPDDKLLMKQLRSENVKLIDGSASDCCTTFNYEIKVKSHLRNFTLYPFFYNNNPKIEAYQRGTNLIEAGYNFDHWVVFGNYVRFH